jgi:hypothetical protein
MRSFFVFIFDPLKVLTILSNGCRLFLFSIIDYQLSIAKTG